jgi:hypothetical protein
MLVDKSNKALTDLIADTAENGDYFFVGAGCFGGIFKAPVDAGCVLTAPVVSHVRDMFSGENHRIASLAPIRFFSSLLSCDRYL